MRLTTFLLLALSAGAFAQSRRFVVAIGALKHESNSFNPAKTVLADFDEDRRIRIPMQPNSRSLNLSNAVAVVVYEAWRQNGFGGSVA